MPEKANHSGFDKCNSCAGSSDGPGLGPLSTVSHPQVCCLYKVARRGQSAPFPNEGSHKRYDYDSLCEDCPSRRTVQEELQAGPVYQPPPSSSNAPQAGIVALPTGCQAAAGVAGSPSRKRKGIEPRLRAGFKKLTLEWRPPRFKQKLWFGTYSEGEEIHRARDAVNYYLGRNVPYFLPDSPMIFAERPLKGIRFEDLLPSCNQVFEGEAAYRYFARQVKEVIHSVLGKQKKCGQRKDRCKVSQLLQKEAFQRLDIYDPIRPSAPGSTSSDTESLSCPYSTANSQLPASYPMLLTTPTTFTQDDEAKSQLASYSMFLLPPRTSTQDGDANSQLAASYPMVLPPPTTQDDEELNALLRSASQIPPDELIGNQLGEVNFPLYENFSFPSAIPTSGDSESTMEENRYSTDLWYYFPNGDPSFPFG